MKLLNIDANAKTVKGQKQGYMTAVLYLAPYKASGYNVCPMAEKAGCYEGCLNTAGRGGIAKNSATIETPAGWLPDNAIQNARITRTKMYFENRDAFMAQLVREIDAFLRKADKAGLIPAIRLNGTSDIEWERRHPELFERFADVQFYDYTKIPQRFTRTLPSNYHLSLSFSNADSEYAAMCNRAHATDGANLVMVMRTKQAKDQNASASFAVDGDEHDLRFLDPAGSLVYLYAKGRAKHDETGFVLD